MCSCFQLLAGAKINELTKHRQTALHLAAQQDLATICSVLLENGVDFAAEDENGNNGEAGGSYASNVRPHSSRLPPELQVPAGLIVLSASS